MKPYLLLLPLVLAGCGSSDDQTVTETLTLESYQLLGRDFLGNQLLCPAVKSASASEPTAYCMFIKGFDYQWGYTVTLKMYKEKVNNPPQDAPSERYVLDSIVSKTEDAVGTLYELKGLELEGLAFNKEDDKYYLKGEPLTCAQAANCDLLASMKDSGSVVDVTLTYRGDGKIQLSTWQ